MSHFAHAAHVFGCGVASAAGSIKLQVSFAKETYKSDTILQKKPVILSILLTVGTPCHSFDCYIIKSHLA